MSTGGTGGNRHVRDGKLPAGYRPPSEGRGNPAASDAPTDGAPTPPIPADQAASGQIQVVENLKAAVEALQRRLTAQQQTIESLARANEKLFDDVEALRKVVSHEEERRVAKSRRQSGEKTTIVQKTSKVTRGKSVRKDMVFRLAGNANMAFSGALNSTLGRKRYAVRTYGDAVNWLLLKYATHATMANAYQDISTIKQQDNETPTAFGHRVETQCDLLNGLFNIQDDKDVVITGLSDLVQAHVRVLNVQFPGSISIRDSCYRPVVLGRHQQAAFAAQDDPPNGDQSRLRDTGPADDDGTTAQTVSHPAAPSGRRPSSQSS